MRRRGQTPGIWQSKFWLFWGHCCRKQDLASWIGCLRGYFSLSFDIFHIFVFAFHCFQWKTCSIFCSFEDNRSFPAILKIFSLVFSSFTMICLSVCIFTLLGVHRTHWIYELISFTSLGNFLHHYLLILLMESYLSILRLSFLPFLQSNAHMLVFHCSPACLIMFSYFSTLLFFYFTVGTFFWHLLVY